MGPLSLLVIIPIIAAIVIICLPKENKFAIRAIATGTAFVTVVISFLLLAKFQKGGDLQFVEQFTWVKELGIDYYLALDGMGVVLCVLNSVILFCGILSSYNIEDRTKEYFALLLILAGGVFGVFLSYDLFIFFLFYEVAVLPMYLLIGVWGTGQKEYAAMKLTLMLLFGSALIMVALLAIYWSFFNVTGQLTFNLKTMMDALHSNPTLFQENINILGYQIHFQTLIYPMVFMGFGVLSGLFPFHTWSPDGHASAPTAVSMLHAGVLMKLGAFGIIRIGLALLPDGAATWALPFALLTLINIVYGALAAMNQTDLKYIVAYSSVSHMGIVNLGICAMTIESIQGSVLQMISHGMMTGLFFGLIGIIYSRLHTRDIRKMGGIVQKMPFATMAFTFAGFASLGLPGLSGFAAEVMVFMGTVQAKLPAFQWIAVVACISVVFTAIYILRSIQKIFYGPFEIEKNQYFATLTDATSIEKTAMSILMGFILLIGLYPAFTVRYIFDGLLPVFRNLGL
ncbi:MAG: NADH-quinone oxidoreductase subunit M [Candidatus Cloacimonadota bacterium]|nr:MAG: NADH-quinone oxidoreductase subunit M [Candidatus Cloacimonadota bacterium]